jgi:hypothetical protein
MSILPRPYLLAFAVWRGLPQDPRCGCDISLIPRVNHEEDKLPHLRDDLPALLSRDQGNNTRWDCLGYLVQFTSSK